jgi:hypothetical protein
MATVLCVLYDDPKGGYPTSCVGAHSYSAGDATGGSEEAARFKG